MENVATYSEARSEFTKQLATFLVPGLVSWFQQTWATAFAANRHQAAAVFQSSCEDVAKWNQDRIEDEIAILLKNAGCNYMEELMTAVFIAHTKVLTAVRLSDSKRKKKMSIVVPKLDQFLHRIFRECARAFWKAPFLFMNTGSIIDQQKNVLQMEAAATEAISSAVRGLLPVKQILEESLEEGDEEDAAADVPVAEVPAPVVAEVPVPTPVVAEVPVAEAPVPTPVVAEVPVPVVAEAPAPAVPTLVVTETDELKKNTLLNSQPAVNIDTERSVVFSDYDAIFQPGGEPKMKFAPKTLELDDDDGPSDRGLVADEQSAQTVGDDEIEDLDDVPLSKSIGIDLPLEDVEEM